MDTKHNPVLADAEVRRAFEEELLVAESTDNIAALLESLDLPQRELAQRLGVTPGRISQILSGSENLTLHTLGAVGWALGVRFEVRPVAMADRAGTPALDDPPAPEWLGNIEQRSAVRYVHVEKCSYVAHEAFENGWRFRARDQVHARSGAA